MANELDKISVTAVSTLESIVTKAKAYGRAAKALNTRRAYSSDWKHFARWCEGHGLECMPATPATVAAYLTDNASILSVATLGRRLAAIRAHHTERNPIDLTGQAFRDVWAGIRRQHGKRPNKKRALVTADLRKAVTALPDTLIGKRDRALLLVGFASAMRRSELAAIVIGESVGHQARFTDNGLLIELGASKSDQEGKGVIIGVPFGSHAETCPVRALRSWLEASGIASGPVFRGITRHGRIGDTPITGQGIADAVKRAVYNAAIADGLKADQASALAATVGGHSLKPSPVPCGLRAQAA